MFPIPPGSGPLLRLLVVVAHPGDETFACGSVLLQAAACGVTTAVTCATRGEAGEVRRGVELPAGGVAGVRESELRSAAALLGVRRARLLGFRDSGSDGPAGPDTLAGADLASVLEAVAADVDDFRPDVLVTLDASKGGGRDEARVLEVTLRVAAERGLPVYLVRSPDDRADEGASVVLDTHVFLADRWRAIRAHRSQVSPFEGLPADVARQRLSVDRLVRVPARVATRTGS